MKKKIPPSQAKPPVILQVASQQDQVCFDELTKHKKLMETSIQKSDKRKQISENEEPLKRNVEHLRNIDEWLHIIQVLSQCFSTCHKALDQCFMTCLTLVAFFVLLIVGLIVFRIYGDHWLLLQAIFLLALLIKGTRTGDNKTS